MTKNDFDDVLCRFGITPDMIEGSASDCGLITRKRLVGAGALLYAFCMESAAGMVSYNDVAACLDEGGNIPVSRQAIRKKCSGACLEFFKAILAGIIKSKIKGGIGRPVADPSKFKRVLVQDSTIIKLPSRLFDVFSGVSNGHTKVCNARVQGTYDILNENFVGFSIDPYTKNDLKAAPETGLSPGDLTLRDRGYLTNSEIRRHKETDADCIYRYKFGSLLWDETSEEPVDLLKELKKKGRADKNIRLNDKERTVARIVAEPVNQKVADERRRKAMKENKSAPSKEYLGLLSWSIFITTLPRTKAGYDDILNLYGLRWRIEVVFKSWKSNIGFDKIHNVSETQLKIILTARFIMISICTQHIYTPCKDFIKKEYGRYLSLLKTLRHLIKYPRRMVDVFDELQTGRNGTKTSILKLVRYCTYEKRKDRKNYEQQVEAVFS